MPDEQALTAMILPFYRKEQPDLRGRMLEEIWAWDFDRLEYTHDYIQWLFPLAEKSQFNLYAPVLDGKTIQVFRTDRSLRVHLYQSLRVMLTFYGLTPIADVPGQFKIVKSDRYPLRKKQWVSIRNHNYLRITRILKCLTLLGLPGQARSFYDCLSDIYSEDHPAIREQTFQFWASALKL